ncbi:MAG TPA: DUF4905 domain-containing protein [Candidatus Kapabacteria bacterium]|nr:DUF4905 domain-containing protein [Candidatus Kapabacteria bacterium]
MGFLDKIFSHKPSWQFNTGGTVWKLVCSKNLLVGDMRDTEHKTSSFFALDFQTGETLWKNISLNEAWWIGIQSVMNDTIFLHGFEKPDMPIPKGIYALDLTTGSMLWQNNDMTFLFSYNNKLYVQRAGFREKNFYELDPRAGEILYDYGTNEEGIAQLKDLAASEENWEGYMFSEQIGSYSPKVQETLAKHFDGARVRGGIDVVETNGVVIMSYHQPARGADAMLNNLVTNTLKVVDLQTSVVLFEDILLDNAPMPMPDTFFVKDDVLMYVKDRTRVTGVVLEDLRR